MTEVLPPRTGEANLAWTPPEPPPLGLEWALSPLVLRSLAWSVGGSEEESMALEGRAMESGGAAMLATCGDGRGGGRGGGERAIPALCLAVWASRNHARERYLITTSPARLCASHEMSTLSKV